MIFDWEANSEAVEARGSLTADEPWDRRHFFQQEECLVWDLLWRLKETDPEAEKEWEDIMRATVASLPEREKGLLVFPSGPSAKKRLYRAIADKTLSMDPRFKKPMRSGFGVSGSELAHINSLPAEGWFRGFCLLALSYRRFQTENGEPPLVPPDVLRWCYQRATSDPRSERPFDPNWRKRLLRYDALAGKPLDFRFVKSHMCLSLAASPWEGGSPSRVFLTPEEVASALPDLVDYRWEKECPGCGERFRGRFDQGTDLCVSCRASEKRAKKLDKVKKSVFSAK